MLKLTKHEAKVFGLGILAAVLAVVLLWWVIEYPAIKEREREAAAEEQKLALVKPPELPLAEFNEEELKNKAVLFVQKEKNIEETEQLLVELADTYNLPIEKVYFGEKVETFVEEQEQKINTHYPIVAELGTKLLSKEEDGQTSFNEKANQIILTAMSKLESGDTADSEIKAVAKQTKLTEKEVLSYLENRMKLSEVKIERPIYKEEGAVLVFFNENQEYGRVNALEQETASLQWLLISKGLLNLSQTEKGKEALEALKNEDEVIVSFGSNTCPFCVNTTPVIEEMANEQDVAFIAIDLDAPVHTAAMQRLTDNHLTAPVENTPTVVFFKEGKEISRFVGQQDYFTMEKFISDNREAIAVKEEKETVEKGE